MFNLFLSFLKIGAFTFGGGYAMIPLIEEELVVKKQLLSQDDFLNYIAIAQSFPGAIAVNLSLLLGNAFYGSLGGLLCLLGVVLPSFFSIMLLTIFYSYANDSIALKKFFTGIRPVVVSLLFYSFFRLMKNIDKSYLNIALVASSFVLVFYFSISPVFVIILGGVLSLCLKS